MIAALPMCVASTNAALIASASPSRRPDNLLVSVDLYWSPMTRLHRVTQDPDVMEGRPSVRGLRVTALSPRCIEALADAGIAARHWSRVPPMHDHELKNYLVIA